MSSSHATRQERIDTKLDERTLRALAECMTVLPHAPGLYTVVGENAGGEYTVDARTGVCSCPDHEYRDVECKHIRRVRYATGQQAIPGWVDPDAVDPQLGEHVDGRVRHAQTDGGVDGVPVTCRSCDTDYLLTPDSTNECPDCGLVDWKRRPMTDGGTTTRDGSTTDARETVVGPRHAVLGIDTEGAIHHWDRRHETVHVIHNGTRTHRLSVPIPSVEEYLAHVDSVRGWTDLRYLPGGIAGAISRLCDDLDAQLQEAE